MVEVLLVEDNPDDALLVREMLAQAGEEELRLEHVESLKQALERVAAAPPGVVLLDLSLPDSRGLDGLFRLLAAGAAAAVIVLTGTDDRALGVDAVRAGAQDYLVKGQVGGALLGRAIRYAIERKRNEAERSRLIRDLQEALASVKQLQGLLPICSWCKKIRDDRGEWNRIESYIRERSEAQFTHSICPQCAEEHFPPRPDGG